jgi:hypothetical protein
MAMYARCSSMRTPLALCGVLALSGSFELGCGGEENFDAATDRTRSALITRTDDVDCPPGIPCDDVPAAYAVTNMMTGAYGNYDLADRERDGLDIRYIVIHTTEVSYDGTITIFQDPKRAASAHYLVRSRDGHLAKFVSPDHVAWHAGNWYFNMHSVGIEHEAYSADEGRWFSDALYETSAALVRHLAARYDIPLDRDHIIGHDEIPGLTMARTPAMHWDPGPYWDWNRFMRMVRGRGEDAPGDRRDDGSTVMGPVRIAPEFSTNRPPVSYCFTATDCREVPGMPSNFLYLRQGPSADAPLIVNSYFPGTPGDRMNNWGNKAGAGRLFYRIDRSGDWDAIYFSGQTAWFHNPGQRLTRIPRLSSHQAVVTPKPGSGRIAVYGGGYPGDGAYTPPKTPVRLEKVYEIAEGQRYVALGPVPADYYWAKVWAPTLPMSSHEVVKDDTPYYVVSYNHRMAVVRGEDVVEVRGTTSRGSERLGATPPALPAAPTELLEMPLRDLKGID